MVHRNTIVLEDMTFEEALEHFPPHDSIQVVCDCITDRDEVDQDGRVIGTDIFIIHDIDSYLSKNKGDPKLEWPVVSCNYNKNGYVTMLHISEEAYYENLKLDYDRHTGLNFWGRIFGG